MPISTKRRLAEEFAGTEQQTYVHPFDDFDVIAGQGVAMERGN